MIQTNTNMVLSDDKTEYMENNIKAITAKVNERLSAIFSGKINDLRDLQSVCMNSPTALAIRVWNDINRKYPGLRDIILGQDVNTRSIHQLEIVVKKTEVTKEEYKKIMAIHRLITG